MGLSVLNERSAMSEGMYSLFLAISTTNSLR